MHSSMNFIITLFCFLPFQLIYSAPPNQPFSSVVLPVTGNVYPTGYYHATVNIGNPPKSYYLDIDTGSDLTWLQCDAPCSKCTPAPHKLYKPNKDLVACMDPLCASVYWPETHQCQSPKEQCDYTVQYADDGSSMGVLVKDSFSLQYINGTVAKSVLVFGCGYNQEVPDSMVPPYTDGILGLGLGKASILHQLQELGVTRSVVGHCLSAQGGGYLFFGDELVPSSGVVWTPMSTTEIDKHYSLGTAELFLGGKTSGSKGLPIVFDSGSTYTYFTAEAYKALLSMLMKDRKGKKIYIANEDKSLPLMKDMKGKKIYIANEDKSLPLMKDMKGKKIYIANEDKSLPVCWKGSKPFKSIYDVKNLFEPITLRFKKSKLQLDPEAYLIISKNGNACLGILNGSEVGLGNINIIGDISFQDKIVIYDNEKKQIGWTPANCNRLPNIDDDDDDGDPDNASLCKPYGTNLGILHPYCTAK